MLICWQFVKKQGDLRQVFAQASKHSPFLSNRNVGQINARKCQNCSALKKFLKKFFVEYLLLKTTQNKQKYCMEALDDFLAKTLIPCGFWGVDKVILGCYNEVAPRKNWCSQLNKKGCRVHK